MEDIHLHSSNRDKCQNPVCQLHKLTDLGSAVFFREMLCLNTTEEDMTSNSKRYHSLPRCSFFADWLNKSRAESS